MRNIRNIHREAMEMSAMADKAREEGDDLTYIQFKEKAFLLEKEAALELKDSRESEPTRGILFRSAGSLAIELGHFDQAKDLLEIGLDGSPFPDIKYDLGELLDSALSFIEPQRKSKTNVPEIELVQLLKIGDERALAYLFENYYSSLFNLALRYLGDSDYAREIVGETLSHFCSSIKRYYIPTEHKLEDQLLTIAREKIVSFLRTRLKDKQLQDLQLEEFAESFGISDPELLNSIIRGHAIHLALTQRQSMLLLWRFRDNLSYQEISDRLSLSVKEVIREVYNALRSLKKDWGDPVELEFE